MMRVGVIGLGSMGGGIAGCLLRRGFPVGVYARRPEAARGFVEAGAVQAESARALAQASDMLVLSLSDAAAVEDVLFGETGAFEGLAAGTTVIDTSTIAAASARAIAERLAARGIGYLDAPVSGGQQGAQSGTLGCMVGGDAAVLARCRDVLAAFCATVTHVGAVGAGQTVKACNQVAVAGALLGVADAMALARSQGVDLAVMREVLLGGAARSFSLDKHGQRIIDGNYAPGFRARLMRKDLRIALESARAADAMLPGATIAEELLDAACANGRGDWDWSALALQVQKLSHQDVQDQPERP